MNNLTQQLEEIRKITNSYAFSSDQVHTLLAIVSQLQEEVKRKDEALIYAIKAFEENWELSETLKVMEAALMARADD